jgi:hypothetical protein
VIFLVASGEDAALAEGPPEGHRKRETMVRLSRAQIIRLTRLLHMKYRPSEIADLLGVNVDTVYRSYLLNGCPHERDSQGKIWIVGTEFRKWADEEIAERKNTSKEPMPEDQAWCVKCNQRVLMINPSVVYSGGNRQIIQSICPKCGRKVNRARGLK